MTSPSGVGQELTLVRLYAAPREKVFQAWVDCELLAQWWGPRGFTNPVCELDPRPGGAILIDMTGPDGTVYPMGGTVREIVPGEKLVFSTTAFENELGEPGLEDLTEVTFSEKEGMTRVVIHATIVKAAPEVAEALEGMEQGWSESLCRLADVLDAD
jgi:uncharacterized protein YndB with AHSA1/START domain